jgi:hypothetical protein
MGLFHRLRFGREHPDEKHDGDRDRAAVVYPFADFRPHRSPMLGLGVVADFGTASTMPTTSVMDALSHRLCV